MIRAALQALISGEELDTEQARHVFSHCLSGEAEPVLVAGLLTALAVRGETPATITGVAEALRACMEPFDHAFPKALDTCGTGGDGLGMFNISTATAIVVAASGARVVKHGNRAVSSRCGSADLLEALGIKIDIDAEQSRACLDEAGITFLFAPRYHPAMRHAGPIRRALGVPTIFNLVGPLANPGNVTHQLLGVPRAPLVATHAAVLQQLGATRALVVHGAGGADELTLAGRNDFACVGIGLPEGGLDASEVGLASASIESLAGGTVDDNLRLLHDILAGQASPLLDAVLLNAGAALLVVDHSPSLAECLDVAREAVATGAARRTLETWIHVSGGSV